LNKSYKELEETKYEVTPDSLKEKLNIEFGLDKIHAAPDKPETDGLSVTISHLIDKFFQPTPLFATILSVLVIMLFISKQTENADGSEDINRFLKKLNSTQAPVNYLSSDSQKGITVILEDDQLIINQIIGIKRDVHIINSSKDYMEDFNISESENKIIINEKLSGDSIRVIIRSEGIEVYDDWLKME